MIVIQIVQQKVVGRDTNHGSARGRCPPPAET